MNYERKYHVLALFRNFKLRICECRLLDWLKVTV